MADANIPEDTRRTRAPMDAGEARALTDEIKQAAEHVWALLLQAHERKAWQVLGYGSWRDYAMTEFGMSQSRAYQLLDQGRVMREIENASGSTDVELSEAEARDLKPYLAKVSAEVRRQVANSPDEDPAVLVDQVIAGARREVRHRRVMREIARRAVGRTWTEPVEQYPSGLSPAEQAEIQAEAEIEASPGLRLVEPAQHLGGLIGATAHEPSHGRGLSIVDAAWLDAHHAAWGALKVLLDLDLDRVGLLTPAERKEYARRAEDAAVWLAAYQAALAR